MTLSGTQRAGAHGSKVTTPSQNYRDFRIPQITLRNIHPPRSRTLRIDVGVTVILVPSQTIAVSGPVGVRWVGGVCNGHRNFLLSVQQAKGEQPPSTSTSTTRIDSDSADVTPRNPYDRPDQRERKTRMERRDGRVVGSESLAHTSAELSGRARAQNYRPNDGFCSSTSASGRGKRFVELRRAVLWPFWQDLSVC